MSDSSGQAYGAAVSITSLAVTDMIYMIVMMICSRLLMTGPPRLCLCCCCSLSYHAYSAAGRQQWESSRCDAGARLHHRGQGNPEASQKEGHATNIRGGQGGSPGVVVQARRASLKSRNCEVSQYPQPLIQAPPSIAHNAASETGALMSAPEPELCCLQRTKRGITGGMMTQQTMSLLS